MIIGGSGSEKSNPLLNLISQQDDINKIFLYAKNLSEPKYEFLIKRRKKVGIKHLNDPNAFSECSNIMDGFFENTDNFLLLFYIFILVKNCFNKFISSIFSLIAKNNNRFTKFVINTNKPISKTTGNVILILF